MFTQCMLTIYSTDGAHGWTRTQLAPALAGRVRRFGALFRDAGDDEFAGLEAAFAGHGGQFVTQ